MFPIFPAIDAILIMLLCDNFESIIAAAAAWVTKKVPDEENTLVSEMFWYHN